MSQASEVKSLRYSLRPKAGAFDLCMNQNRYGLIRTTVDRKVATTKRNRSPSPLPNIYKRKIRYEVIEDISDARRICKASIQCNGATLTIPKMWQLPERTLAQVTSKPPSTFYDVSKEAHFMNLNEESQFEIFNHLSLNDLCIMAEVCPQLKFAAQKYFDVMYTAVNLAWLSDNDSEQFTLLQAERLLQHFGHLISTITVNTNQLHPTDCKEKLLNLIDKYCGGILFWNTK